MNNTKMWMRRAAAGAVLAAAPALIALGTATASNAAPTGDTSGSTSPSFAPTPVQTTYPYWSGPWYDSSFHHRHASEIQSNY